MNPLGFVFDHAGVVIGEMAHRAGCPLVGGSAPDGAQTFEAGGVYRSERAPRPCSRCSPTYTTLLTHQAGVSDSGAVS